MPAIYNTHGIRTARLRVIFSFLLSMVIHAFYWTHFDGRPDNSLNRLSLVVKTKHNGAYHGILLGSDGYPIVSGDHIDNSE